MAPGATVYIYIPSNVTLTCQGGSGCAAGQGGAGNAPGIPNGENRCTEDGVSYNFPKDGKYVIPAGGAGGSGATGGGAGIYLPENSTLAVYGGGKLGDYIDATERVAKNNDLLCVKMSDAIKFSQNEPMKFFADGSHLTELGRRMYAEYLADKMYRFYISHEPDDIEGSASKTHM